MIRKFILIFLLCVITIGAGWDIAQDSLPLGLFIGGIIGVACLGFYNNIDETLYL